MVLETAAVTLSRPSERQRQPPAQGSVLLLDDASSGVGTASPQPPCPSAPLTRPDRVQPLPAEPCERLPGPAGLAASPLDLFFNLKEKYTGYVCIS